MKEDYLWNKTGSDAEIERLENALKAFRYEETAPPAIPAKAIVLEEKPARKFFNFRFAFAFASCAAAVLILFGIAFQFLKNQTSTTNDLSARNTATKDSEIKSDSEQIQPPLSSPEKIVKPQKDFKPAVVKIRQTIPQPARQNKKTARKLEAKSNEIALTKEEKYAYDQLMLALSITSSKLKIVKDKANGIEERNAVVKTER